jgi:hypothetical protein
VQELSGGSVLANLLTGLGIDERFTRTESGTTSTFLTDLLGSAVSLTNNSGVIQTSYGLRRLGVATTSGLRSEERWTSLPKQACMGLRPAGAARSTSGLQAVAAPAIGPAR